MCLTLTLKLGECGDEVRLLECGSSAQVPREVWMWMEAQICEGDGITRKSVQAILRPDEEEMPDALYGSDSTKQRQTRRYGKEPESDADAQL